MKDQIFTGEDVADALAAAGASLGLPPDRLRYVVLDPGGPGASPRDEARPARIAVMLDAGGRRTGGGARPVLAHREHAGDVLARLRRIVRDLAETAALDLEAEAAWEEERLRLRLLGPGREPLLADGGRALLALEYLLQRVLARDGNPES